jgi:single-stranded DNA-binding protein
MYHQKPLIGVKGRVQTRNVEGKDDKTLHIMEMVAEK